MSTKRRMVPEPTPDPRVVTALSIAGSDPGGGAGAQADLATFLRLGVHGATAITAITVQDTQRVEGFDLVRGETLTRQIEITLADCRVTAIKIGMLGSVENVERVARVLDAHREIPVVLDPVMVAGGGGTLATAAVVDATREHLVPRATIITPNWSEALRLVGDTRANAVANAALASPQRSLTERINQLADDVGQTLLALGAPAALITGGELPDALRYNAPDDEHLPVRNHLYRRDAPPQRFELPRRDGVFHGSGCTLASAIAAHLARGLDLHRAVLAAQDFMVGAVAAAYRSGAGQWIPERRCPIRSPTTR